MEPKQTNHKIKEVIDRLEVESWQLELLVSGFAIFLVAASFDPILEYGHRLSVIQNGLSSQFDILMIIPSGFLASVFFIFVNLLLHLVFRGLWISAIGIRFLSGDIDLESLKLVKPFDRFFANRLKSFDNYIEKLERISSVIFGFTFLLVFMVMSLVLLVLFVQLMIFIIQWLLQFLPDTIENITVPIIAILGLLFFVSSLLYFIDFLTLGFFKRKRWIAVWYYPIYRLFSWITISSVYRPLYYNLVDNQFGRRVVLALVPYMFIMLSLASVRTNSYQFIPEEDKENHLINDYYDDKREEDDRVENVSLPSRYIDNGFLELFIHNQPKKDNIVIEKKFPKLRKPKEEGIKWLFYQRKIAKKDRSPSDSLLMALRSIYEIKIDDSLYEDIDVFFFETEKYKQRGLKTIIDIDHLDRGRYEVKVDKLTFSFFNRDSFFLENFATIPFWKE